MIKKNRFVLHANDPGTGTLGGKAVLAATCLSAKCKANARIPRLRGSSIDVA
jgi:hypothetical protein